jgi:hypothetical protein
VNFFVWYSLSKYDPLELTEFSCEKDALDFINRHAGNLDATFHVVRGQRIGLVPVAIVREYRLNT